MDGLARRKNEAKPQTMEDFLQVPDYYNMEDTSGKKRVCIYTVLKWCKLYLLNYSFFNQFEKNFIFKNIDEIYYLFTASFPSFEYYIYLHN